MYLACLISLSPNLEYTSYLQHLANEHTAGGPDHISPYTLTYRADEITTILYVIFNHSLSTSLLPNYWLKANICPVHKKGSHSNVNNY